MHTEYLIRNQSLRRKVLAIYRPDRKLAGAIGDGRALQMTPGPCRGRQSIKMTAGPYRQIPFPIRLQGPAVNPQDCPLYERRTPCQAVRTHPARDALDYSPPGPCRPPGTVGNTVQQGMELGYRKWFYTLRLIKAFSNSVGRHLPHKAIPRSKADVLDLTDVQTRSD